MIFALDLSPIIGNDSSMDVMSVLTDCADRFKKRPRSEPFRAAGDDGVFCQRIRVTRDRIYLSFSFSLSLSLCLLSVFFRG